MKKFLSISFVKDVSLLQKRLNNKRKKIGVGRLIFLCLIGLNFSTVTAQRFNPEKSSQLSFTTDKGSPSLTKGATFMCGEIRTGNPCNLINNNVFSSMCSVPNPNPHPNPFNIGCVPSWTNTHGTPQLNVNPVLLAINVNHASMRAENDIYAGHPTSEGIAVGIQTLTPGNTYALSILKGIMPMVQ